MAQTDKMALAARWHALLYVPAHVEKFVTKAASLPVDAVILDLEDAVPPARKTEARTALIGAAQTLRAAGKDVLVRINREIEHAVPDIRAAHEAGVNAIIAAKTDGPAHIRLLTEYIDRLEDAGNRNQPLQIIGLIESLAAFWTMREIATASHRMLGLVMGGEDIAAQIHAASNEETLQWPRQQMIFAAAEAGIAVFGLMGSIADYGDVEKVHAVARRSRAFGFWGATCIHPDQVVPIKRAFEPTPAEIEEAQAIVTALDQALAEGKGAVAVSGRMVDAPVAARARRIVDWNAMQIGLPNH